ncbi:p53-induced death domain-containing protein 1-like [Glandiceps talaboti]
MGTGVKKERVVFLLLQHRENQQKLCIDCVQNTTVTDYLKELDYFGFNIRPDGRTPYSREHEIVPGERIFFNIDGDYIRPERRESGPFFLQKDNQKIIFVHPKNVEDNPDDVCRGSVTLFRFTGEEGAPLSTKISEGNLFTKLDSIAFELKHLVGDGRSKSRKDSLQIKLPQPVEGSTDEPTATYIPVEAAEDPRDELRNSLLQYKVSTTSIIPLPSGFQLELSEGFNDNVDISGLLVANSEYSVDLDCYEVLTGDVIRLCPTEFDPSVPLVLSHDFENLNQEIVLKCSSDGRNNWITLDTMQINGTYKAFIGQFQYYAAVSRPIIDHFTVNKSAKNCSSSIDPNICITIPERSTKDVRYMTLQVLSTDESMVDRVCNKYGISLTMGMIINVKDTSKQFLKPVTLTMPLAPRVSGLHNFDDRPLLIMRDNDDDEWTDITDTSHYKITGDYVTVQVEHFSRLTNVRGKPKASIRKTLGKISSQMRNGTKLANILLLQNKTDPCSLCVECVHAKIQDKRLKELRSHGFEAPKGKLPYGPDIEIREGEEIFFSVKGDNVEAEAGNGRHFLMQFNSVSKNHRMVQVKLKDVITGQDGDFVGYVYFYSCVKPKNRTSEKVPGRQFEEMRFTIPRPRKMSSSGPPRSRHRHRRSCSLREQDEVLKKVFMYMADNLIKDEWKQVGYTLGLDSTHFNTIEVNYPNNFWEQKYQMLLLWQQIQGKKATLQRVVGALKERRCNKIAEGVKKVANDDDDMASLTHTDIIFTDSDSMVSSSFSDESSLSPTSPMSVSPRPWTTGAGFCPSEYRKQQRVSSANKETQHVPALQGTAKPLTPVEKSRNRMKSPIGI